MATTQEGKWKSESGVISKSHAPSGEKQRRKGEKAIPKHELGDKNVCLLEVIIKDFSH